MTQSTIFSLEGRGLKLDTAADINAHISPLTSNPAIITELRLLGNTIGVDAARALAPHLSTLTSLERANLADIFTSRLLSEIPPALDSLLTSLLPPQNLHTIDLSDNAFGLNTQAPLVRFLEKHIPLRNLILNNNGLGPEAGTLVADALTRLAEAKTQISSSAPLLETIVCGRNRLENGSMLAWARALAAHGEGVKEVKMVQNGIRQEGIKVLLQSGLSKAKRLEVLDLQDNTFTASGSLVLAQLMGCWPCLRTLGVGDCLLGARGAVMLVEELGKGGNENLEVLRLQYNEIDARGVRAVVDAVENDTLPKLRRVELNGNKFSEEDPAVEALRNILEERRDKNQEDDEKREKGGGDKESGADEQWGLDDLSDLDEDTDDEEDTADGDADEVEERAEREVRDTEEAEEENVPQEEDKSVDDLADQLGKTAI